MAPHPTPMDEARMFACEDVESLRQQDEAAPGGGPGLQRLDARALAERPVQKVGVGQHDLAPVLARCRLERGMQVRLEGLATIEGAFGQVDTDRVIRHATTPLRTNRPAARAHPRWRPPDRAPRAFAGRPAAASAWRRGPRPGSSRR